MPIFQHVTWKPRSVGLQVKLAEVGPASLHALRYGQLGVVLIEEGILYALGSRLRKKSWPVDGSFTEFGEVLGCVRRVTGWCARSAVFQMDEADTTGVTLEHGHRVLATLS